jgi:hypothetical protein
MNWKLTSAELQDMRGWCEDVFSNMPTDATDDEVVRCVQRTYSGGISQFLRDGR